MDKNENTKKIPLKVSRINIIQISPKNIEYRKHYPGNGNTATTKKWTLRPKMLNKMEN